MGTDVVPYSNCNSIIYRQDILKTSSSPCPNSHPGSLPAGTSNMKGCLAGRRVRKRINISPFWGGFIIGIIPALFMFIYIKFPLHNNQYVRMVSYTETNCLPQSEYGRKPLNINPQLYNPLMKAPTIYFITPTYRRSQQKPEFVRLAQTLMQVPNLHWIIVQDGIVPSDWMSPTLREYSLRFNLIACHRMTESVRRYRDWKLSKGSIQRNCGLKWLRDNHISEGVVYFGDDDNTYHLRLFDEIRSTKRASMFPVGSIRKTGVSSPVVKNGVIVDILDPFKRRRFPIDMAGFAVNLQFLATKPSFFQSEPYMQEDLFLQGLDLTLQEFEPKAKNCTEVLVWHTRTEPIRYGHKYWLAYSRKDNNLNDIEEQMVFIDD